MEPEVMAHNVIVGLLDAIGGVWLFQQAPFDPNRLFAGLLGAFARVAVPIGAFALAIMVIAELFNDRRDMRKIVLESIGIVVLIIVMVNSQAVIEWLIAVAGGSGGGGGR